MTSTSSVQTLNRLHEASIEQQAGYAIDGLFATFPEPKYLSAEQRRGIIARYTSVLEGNFIYWMAGAYLSVKSEDARSIVLENLHEEVRDCHPGMLRRFAMSANAVPTDSDALAVYPELTKVRLFLGRLSGVRIVLMMAFFEGLIQRFMPFLAELAERQGSFEREYTDVHGVCDVVHTQELFHALAAEMALNPPEPATSLFEGVDLLRALIHSIVDPAMSGGGVPAPC